MEYTFMLLKHKGDGLLGVMLSATENEREYALAQNPTWDVINSNRLTTNSAYPKTLCNVVLTTKETHAQLFMDIVDTWLGPTQDDPLNNYDRYASQEDSKTVLDKDYLDRLESS